MYLFICLFVCFLRVRGLLYILGRSIVWTLRYLYLALRNDSREGASTVLKRRGVRLWGRDLLLFWRWSDGGQSHPDFCDKQENEAVAVTQKVHAPRCWTKTQNSSHKRRKPLRLLVVHCWMEFSCWRSWSVLAFSAVWKGKEEKPTRGIIYRAPFL